MMRYRLSALARTTHQSEWLGRRRPLALSLLSNSKSPPYQYGGSRTPRVSLSDRSSLLLLPHQGFLPARQYSSTATNSTAIIKNFNHSADLARMMVPADANWAGNVHGGTVMQLMEEAAGVAANRYFNQVLHGPNKVCALTSRVERMAFLHPVHVGDVSKVHAEVVFASTHTVAVSVTVSAERLAWSKLPQSSTVQSAEEDQNLICNRALLWLVGVVLPEQHHASVHEINPKHYARALAPPFPIPDQHTDPLAWKIYQRAEQTYETRKRKAELLGEDGTSTSESDTELETFDETCATSSPSDACFTPDYSAVELVQVVLPSDCMTQTGLVSGGFVMKLMDNACGVAAVRHCGTNIVTISVDCVNLKAPVLMGDVLRVKAIPTFTSSKSMEIEVCVVAERFLLNENGVLTRHEIVTTQRAYFTFVSLPLSSEGATPSSLPMRPLVLRTPQDHVKFEAGKRRYEYRKQQRKIEEY